jgi:hypothetical protein
MNLPDFLTNLRTKIFLIFVLFIVSSVAITLVTIRLNNQQFIFTNQRLKLEVLSNKTLKVLRLGQDFFVFETINPNYFRTGNSSYLADHKKAVQDLHATIAELRKTYDVNPEVMLQIDSVQVKLADYSKLFNRLVTKIELRGFKDYGLEGEMRSSIHRVEQYQDRVSQNLVLTLRRHEKDYLLRADSSYRRQLEMTAEDFVTDVENSNKLSQAEKERVKELLGDYGPLSRAKPYNRRDRERNSRPAKQYPRNRSRTSAR